MALALPDHVNPGDSGHVADTNLIIDALAELDARGGVTAHDHAGLYDPAGTASAAVSAHDASPTAHAALLAAAGAYADQEVTVATTAPVGAPARDGILWIKVP